MKEFRFPDVGEGIVEGEIVAWLIKEGDSVREDQDLVEVETDKAVVTLPCPYTGKILKLHHQAGSVVKVGEVLVTVDEEAEQTKKNHATSVVGALEDAEDAVKPKDLKQDQIQEEVQALPSIRALAKELGINLALVRGSGPGGRITREDVERARGRALAEVDRTRDPYGPVKRIPLRGIRRTIARHLAEASRRAVHVTIWADADITDLERVKAKEKHVASQKGVKLTYLPFVVKAVVPALRDHPMLNASMDDETEEIIVKHYINMGIAVDTSEGLMVFVIKDADQKTILDVAGEIRVLAEKARQRKLDLGELKGGTFTITNYGVIGASYGTPIINDPEVAILGMGKIEDKPVVKEGKIAIRRILPLSLAFDHRVIDGVEAARFMNAIIEHLEDPDLMLIEGR